MEDHIFSLFSWANWKEYSIQHDTILSSRQTDTKLYGTWNWIGDIIGNCAYLFYIFVMNRLPFFRCFCKMDGFFYSVAKFNVFAFYTVYFISIGSVSHCHVHKYVYPWSDSLLWILFSIVINSEKWEWFERLFCKCAELVSCALLSNWEQIKQ